MNDFPKLINSILDEVSGKYAFDWVAKISQYNRVVGSQDFHKALNVVKKELETFGLDEIKLHKYPADGKTKTWEWIVTQSWDIKSGELRLIEPKEELLCRFQDIPMCVLGRSKSCDINAELIDVGKGLTEEDFEGKNVNGKIILMEAPRIIVSTLYVEKGALGVIIYPSPKRAASYKGMTIYNRFPAIAEDLKITTFGFSITSEQALYLKELLKKGSVKLHAKIDAKIFNGELGVLSAVIRGTEKPNEEIILSAHICHPAAGANDNASGSAGLLELARSLTVLIQQKILDPPKRTIRFLWVPEFHGTFLWVKEHEDIVKNALFNINLDMIGEHPINVGEPCSIWLSPFSRPSILNDLTQYFTKLIADHPKGVAVNGTTMQMRYRINPYSGGSDHVVFVTQPINIPGLMIGHNDPFWHSSLDTIEKCDSTELKRIIAIALCTSYISSIQTGMTFITIWPIMEENFYQRLGNTKKILFSLYAKLNQKIPNLTISRDEKALLGIAIIKAFVNYEKDILDSVKLLDTLSSIIEELILEKYDELNKLKTNLLSQWTKLCKHALIDITIIKEPDTLRQKWVLNFLGRRNLKYYMPILMSEKYQKFKVPEPPDVWGGDVQELMNFIGLSLNLKEISATLTLEFQHIFYPSEVLKFANFLEEKGIMKKS
ncbi:hypothetical protein LCGC14_1191260 [marine sediment metagenome]|uniref:Peptidase M28 domain-containing protein n=1 Tax=marine sediment metagenome TaxID=412755 RepID=A0A0F9LJB4_9ZZZZ